MKNSLPETRDITATIREKLEKVGGYAFIVIIILLLPLIFVGLLLWLAYASLKGKWYALQALRQWRGKYILLVYSNSRRWQGYFEDKIIPKLQDTAVVLNWSERLTWAWAETLELKIFRHFAGVTRFTYEENGKRKTSWAGDEFCPLAVILKPWWRPKVIRFWQAFKDYKHGKESGLKAREEELFVALS